MSATEVLLIGIILLLLLLIGLSLRKHQVQIEPKDIESAWQRSGLEHKLGQLVTYTEDVRRHHEDLIQMLRAPLERASLGELALEQILSDQLPPDMFGIRKRIFKGAIPDAYIRSSAGIICIDPKFPLENYRKMVESKNSNDRLRKQGVQVVSPLTLSHKTELIKARVHAQELSEQAKEVQKDIKQLEVCFESIDERWKILQMHLENAKKKAEDLDKAYKALREEFDRISRHERTDRLI